jgi:hypothetical protein
MSRPLACALSTLMLATALPAAAQTPSALRDLVGARAGQAEGELNRRGYQATDRSEVVGDGRMTYWRNGNDCVSIMTRDGRYASINQAGRSECGSGGSNSSNATAIAAGVAIVGLAAAIAAHNNRHRDADADHDREYQRGYEAALHAPTMTPTTRPRAITKASWPARARVRTAATPTAAGCRTPPTPRARPARVARTSSRTAPMAPACPSAYATWDAAISS